MVLGLQKGKKEKKKKINANPYLMSHISKN